MSCRIEWKIALCSVLIALVSSMGKAADNSPGYHQTFKEYESYQQVANFANDDLLQGLTPDRAGGLCENGTYITDTTAGDAGSVVDPGQATQVVSTGWHQLSTYLVYTFRHACDIREIRLTGVLSPGKDTPGDSSKTRSTYGDIVLGSYRRTVAGGKPPIRPAENAIEVMYEGETIWTPVVEGVVSSPRRTGSKGFWQGVWKFKPGVMKNVVRIKFTLGAVSTWSSYGACTRLVEADVIGTKSKEKAQKRYQHVPVIASGFDWTGYVFPSSLGGMTFEWSGSGVKFSVKAVKCRLRFQAPSQSQYWVRVDNGKWRLYSVRPIVDISHAFKQKADGLHTVEIIKKTERPVGVETFLGIDVDPDGKILPLQKRAAEQRRILFLGDSITVGMQSPKAGQTDIMSSYAWMVARRFGADIRVVGVSGVGVFKGWRPIRFIDYFKALADRADKQKMVWQPDLVIINLGTNDMSRGVGGKDYQQAMKELVEYVSDTYERATILVMVPWTYSCYKKELKTVVDESSANGRRVSLVMTNKKTWMVKGGMSDNTHPNIKGHRAAARRLIPEIRRTMNWK